MKLRLKNWMSHSDTIIDVGDEVGMVVGPNGIGKTAIRDAIEFVYLGTGKLRGIETKKDLAAYSIQDGERECTVTLEQNGIRLQRTMNSSGTQKIKLNNEPVALAEQDSLVRGTAEDVLRIILEPTAWLDVPSARRAELLILATSSRVDDPIMVDAAMTKVLEPDSPAEAAAISKIAKIAAGDGMRAGEEAAVTARVEAKRKRDELPTAEPASEYEGIDLAAHPIEAHTDGLAKLRKQREAALVQTASTVADAKARADEAYQALQVLLAWEPGEVSASADIDRASAINGVEMATKRLGELTTIHAAALKAHDDAAALASGEPQTVEHPGQCPHLPVMKCPVKPEKFREAQAKAAPEVPTAGELQELEQAVADADADLGVVRESIRKWTISRDEAIARVAANAAIVQASKDHSAKVDAAEAKVSALDAALKAAQAAAAAAPAPGMDLAAIDARIAKGERVVAAKRSFDEAKAKHAENRARAESLGREIEAWDLIAKAMKPGGPVELELSDSAASPFLADLGTFVPLIGGEIALQSDMTILVGPERRHPSQLSTSQRLALGIAVQHAFARSVGFPILICDALDLFDGAHRAAWAACAQAVLPNYTGGVMGLATITGGEPGVPPEGFATWYLDRGERGEVFARPIVAEE